MKLEGCCRISIGVYTTWEDLERMIEAAASCEGFFWMNDDTLFNWIPASYADVCDDIAQQKHWQYKLKKLIQLSTQLPKMPDGLKTDAHLIRGCEVKAWLAVENKVNSSIFVQTVMLNL